MDKKRAFIAFFWAAGMIYTGHNLIENCIRYKQYNSMTINKYDKNGEYESNSKPVEPYFLKSESFWSNARKNVGTWPKSLGPLTNIFRSFGEKKLQ